MPDTDPELEVVIDSGEFSRLIKSIRAFDKDLATRTRAQLRAAAKPAVAEVQQILRAPTGHPTSRTNLRATLAKGTKLSIRTGKTAGVAITTSGSKLPNPRLAKLYNRPSWRHPVFGDREVWVTQKGRPYFGVVYKHRTALAEAMQRALDGAAAQIGTGS